MDKVMTWISILLIFCIVFLQIHEAWAYIMLALCFGVVWCEGAKDVH